MIAVSDTGPLHYLVLIDAVDSLASLYDHVVIPRTVADELKAAGAPAAVRNWMSHPPSWLEIQPDPPSDPTLAILDPGESAAITLGLLLRADRLLIDDWDGRRHLVVTGTLGVLAKAHQRQLLVFENALTLLCATNFYVSSELIDHMRRRLTTPDT